jgi:dolichol-phosphate mannosyltransferase
MNSSIETSVVVPVFNASACLPELHRRLVSTLQAIGGPFEIVFVDDCSTDQSWSVLREIAESDSRVHAIQLSRNFGQHPAIAAGLTAARGRFIAVMDCDLQDRPEEIPKLQAAMAAGDVDIVFARRKNRSDSAMRKGTSRAFFALLNLLSGSKIDPEIGSFSLITRQVAADYLRVADRHGHYLQVLRWVGFRHTAVDIVEAPRFAGRSSYTLPRLIRHFWNGIVSQSERLLHVSIYLGFVFCAVAAVQVIYLIIRKLYLGISVAGWASLMVVLWLVGGLVLFSLGVLGMYIGKIFEQGQRRPPFVIRTEVVQREERNASGNEAEIVRLRDY